MGVPSLLDHWCSGCRHIPNPLQIQRNAIFRQLPEAHVQLPDNCSVHDVGRELSQFFQIYRGGYAVVYIEPEEATFEPDGNDIGLS